MKQHLPAQPRSSTVLPLGRSLAPVRSQLLPEASDGKQRSSVVDSAQPAIAAAGHNFANLALHSREAIPQGLTPAWIQPKLTIGAPNDRYEQEADRVAKQVVQQLNTPTVEATQPHGNIQRKPKPEDELQMKPIQSRGEEIEGGTAFPDLTSAINRARGSGQPLDATLQQSMGQAMGANLRGVRVHTDAQADQLNRSIQAKAFTTGRDVFFQHGVYQPKSRGGQELIAHELTHVVQQNAKVMQRNRGENLGGEKLPKHDHVNISKIPQVASVVQRANGKKKKDLGKADKGEKRMRKKQGDKADDGAKRLDYATAESRHRAAIIPPVVNIVVNIVAVKNKLKDGSGGQVFMTFEHNAEGEFHVSAPIEDPATVAHITLNGKNYYFFILGAEVKWIKPGFEKEGDAQDLGAYKGDYVALIRALFL